MILVTGGNGFVGRPLLRALEAAQQPLRLVLREGTRPLSEPVAHAEIVWTSDLFAESARWWADVLEGVDTVVHLAWYAEPGVYLSSPKNIACLQGTLNLARACIDGGVRRFIGIGTCAEYQPGELFLHPKSPLKPQTLYAACKTAAFQVLCHLFGGASVEFAWCRLFYLYGDGEDRRRLVPYLRERLEKGEAAELTSGNQIRDFLEVHDAAQMIAEVVLGSQQGPINICSGRPITIRQLAERIADEYGRRDLLKFGARADNLFDPPRIVGIKGSSGET